MSRASAPFTLCNRISVLVLALIFNLQAVKAAENFGVETRRQLNFIKIDRTAAKTADELSYIFVYLHRNGIDLKAGNWAGPFEREKQKRIFMRGLLKDGKFRESSAEWLKLFGSNLSAVVDPLGETEAYVLSRDALSLALLRSHRFDARLREISDMEKIDLRPIVRRAIRELQFTSDGAFVLATGGFFGFLFKALNIVKAGVVVSSASAVALGGTVMWDHYEKDDTAPPTGQQLRDQSAADSAQILSDVAIAKEVERRLLLVSCAAELKSNKDASCLNDLSRIRPKLVEYLDRLRKDELPIKIKDDAPNVRSDVELALKAILDATAPQAAIQAVPLYIP